MRHNEGTKKERDANVRTPDGDLRVERRFLFHDKYDG